MSQKYTGGFITKSPVAPTSSAASGIWTLDQQQQAKQAGNWPSPPMFIEDLFSTYLYTGNSSTQTITNGIDLSGQGGLVWRQGRSAATGGMLIDTSRGIGSYLISYSTDAAQTGSNWIDSFNSNGFTMNSSSFNGGATYASWTFRKQPKFFDVVTYTGNGGVSQTINHNLGSVPGCMIVKSTSAVNNWKVYHRSLGTPAYEYNLNLNTSDPRDFSTSRWASDPTSTTFSVASNTDVNASGVTYVAYLWAHDAGGFPVSGGGSTNGISCGSWTGTGLTFTVNLGYEPQWLMFKRTDDVGDWIIIDNMRGVTVDGADAYLRPNTSGAEANITGGATLNSTGFSWATGVGSTFIYIAIRRGPMKTPTVGTSVFSPVLQTNTGAQPFSVTAGFPVDSALYGQTTGWGVNFIFSDRLRGATNILLTTSTNSEATNNSTYGPSVSALDSNTQFKDGMANVSVPIIYWMFRRTPGFFDEVCYTGTGTYGAANHNLGVTPELVIYKSRSNAVNWGVIKPVSSIAYYDGLLNSSSAFTYYSNDPSVAGLYTSTQFCKYQDTSAYTYVAYLFATCAGVSKVGSYTGTGTTLQINCGFTAGARFVLIKRADSTGAWYVWDSARGIIAGNDPYLLLNSTAAEDASTDYIDTYNAGFEITSTAPAAINANGGTYIFLAVA